MAPKGVVAFQVYWVVRSAGSWFDSPEAVAEFSAMVLLVGYVYVAIAWLLRWFLGMTGLLERAPRHPVR